MPGTEKQTPAPEVKKNMELTKSLYGKLNIESHWYALATRNRHEKKVAERLQQKGITHYLPLITAIRYWSDRKKKVTEPLFSCYAFVKIALRERMSVLQTDGAVKLVTFNNVPVPIPDYQIHSIRQAIETSQSIQRLDHWQIGQHVEVISGPLKGVRGILQKKKGRTKLAIAVDGINQAIEVEIGADEVKEIESQVLAK
ncbi:UpxY family transcription antiterminator [candidate division KSB1 bacterium]|nr:UpxY family transcription antiterminator [candidate division KSB1 bacterium]